MKWSDNLRAIAKGNTKGFAMNEDELQGQWGNLRNVILIKISNLQNETRILREQLVSKESEIIGLREAQDQIERFAPKS